MAVEPEPFKDLPSRSARSRWRLFPVRGIRQVREEEARQDAESRFFLRFEGNGKDR